MPRRHRRRQLARAGWLGGLAALLCGVVLAPSRPVVAGPAAAGVVDWDGLAPALLAKAPKLDPKVLGLALRAVRHVRRRGLKPRPVLGVIDYGLPSTRRRLWVFDLVHRRLLFHLLVAHGAGSGERLATRFSNREGSHQTSLGLYRAAGTYTGHFGYSLVLQGLDRGFNDHAAARHIVVHGFASVNAGFVKTYGVLWMSWGCPTVGDDVARPVIDALKHGGLVFAYAPDRAWLKGSTLLR